MPKFSEYVESDYNEEYDKEPIRTRILRKGVGIIEMISFSDETIMYCPKCKEAGFQVKLGPRILMPNEERQPDYDSWLQCTSCAEIVAAYVVEHDATIIRDDIPTVETPFENTTEIMGANARRTSKTGKRATAKRNKERYRPHHKDPDIQLELDKGLAVNILYDSSY